MLALLLLALQSVSGPPGDEPAATPVTAQRDCRPGEGDEIVVCGGDAEAYRLRKLEARPSTALPPARVRLSERATLQGSTEAAGPAGAFTRIVAGVKIDF